jgi:hypothetical protein
LVSVYMALVITCIKPAECEKTLFFTKLPPS